MRRADIAFLIHALPGGGAERVTLNLMPEFLARGLALDLVLGKATGPLLAEVPPGVRVVDCAAADSLQWRGAVERYLAQTPPRTLVAQMEGAAVVALWARRRVRAETRIAAVGHNRFTRHAAMAPGWKERHLLRWLMRWLYREADAVIGVSEGVARDLEAVAWLPRGRVEAIHNPVVTGVLLAQAAEPLDHPWVAPDAPPVILGAGRLTAQKDFPTLIEAFARLRRERAARLVILGEGEARPALEALVARLGLGADVALPGFTPNPHAWMARAALFVLSSAWEGFGNVLVEAMACGCPVVSTDCESGPAEILGGGRHGPLVPVGDPAALATAMAAVLDAPPPRASLVARAEAFQAAPVAEAYLAALGLA